MPASEPQIRVLSQQLLRTVDSLPAAERDAIRALAGRWTIDAIEAILPVAWTPMSHHMALSDAVRDVVGPSRNIETWRATMNVSIDRPVLRGFMRMSADLFGTTPVSYLRQGERIFPHLTRDVGTFAFETDGPSSGHLTLRGFPAGRYRFICFVEGLAGCIESFLAVTVASASVGIDDLDEARGLVRYRTSW